MNWLSSLSCQIKWKTWNLGYNARRYGQRLNVLWILRKTTLFQKPFILWHRNSDSDMSLEIRSYSKIRGLIHIILKSCWYGCLKHLSLAWRRRKRDNSSKNWWARISFQENTIDRIEMIQSCWCLISSKGRILISSWAGCWRKD